ncbi:MULTISPECIES: DUF2155 domain-containing protein [Methylosinus]|uniref:DUF2155 domain-containing protein n=1 Tax=Methylosinus trichosporium (strain ATCC 35070 / NCIMB 11131 / UNIQEM 75 / OB3b) TaxID=595536 RepID=A0A2D2D681_METT3|nr:MULTISPECIES: DUF2155 domain-containing protein [Methylosinus]ATQ70486.1 DUF2155 domain-containing protein [Methylosinus trichosporium OB3b]OBS51264.1 hypothetical protein A8B73_17475 [Methylosinus sp. 3S-1]
MTFRSSLRAILRRLPLAGAAALGLCAGAAADPIRHPTAVFAGLDKTTGRIINFDVAIDETVQFGSLQITPRVCNTRPQTEAPQTTSFVEVDDQDPAKNEAKRIFSGWMFAASPGLHGVEHSVYDVWLTDCKGGKEIVQAPASAEPAAADPAAATPAPVEKKRSRSRKVEPVAPTPIEAAPIGPRDSVAPEAPIGEDGAEPPPAAPPEKKKSKKKSRNQPPPAAEPRQNAPSPLFPF